MQNTCIRKRFRVLLLIACVVLLTGFTVVSEMPFNGDIVFHEIALTIPDSFIRDSTQSSEDVWIFEKGFYSKYIILTRSDYSGSELAALDRYAQSMKNAGVNVRRETLLERNAVFSRYTRYDQYCQEMLFAHEGSLYAIALRCGNEKEFRDLLQTVSLDPVSGPADTSDRVAKRRPSTVFGRIMDYISD